MDVPCDMLLHPELLTNEQLIYIIHQRHLRVAYMEKMHRDELLELFHRFCVPYGQRKYRDSGRGKVLNKTRQMSPECTPKFMTMDNNQCRKIRSNHDRLKPPPDLLSGHMKRIKIESKAPTKIAIAKDTCISKRKMSVDEVEEPSPPKKERKPITWP